MEKPKKSLEEVTMGEISDIYDGFVANGSIFNFDFSQLSKNLLKHFLPISPYQSDFKEIVEAYLVNVNFYEDLNYNEEKDAEDFIKSHRKNQKEEISKVIKNETDFHKYISKTYFGVVKLPKDELLKIFIATTDDLKAVDQTLEDIRNKLETITKNNNSAEIQEKKPILHHYQKLNEGAKEQILSFLKDEIKGYALANCFESTLTSSLMWRVPYSYQWNPKAYKPAYPHDLDNKLSGLAIGNLQKVKKLYKEDKSAFHLFITDYIKDNEIIFMVREMLDSHHILDMRKEIVDQVIDVYISGNKVMFAIAVPSIIEGIFHDLCILVGESENDLLKEGFQYKLNVLKDHFSWELHYEYYSFRFRLFRNKVSHGRLVQEDVDELADLLILDLYHVFTLVKSDKLQLNHKRFVIDQLNKNLLEPDYKYLMQYLLLEKVDIPSFYKLDKQIEEVEKLLAGDKFWEFLQEEIKDSGEPTRHGVQYIVQILAKRKPFDSRCTKIFKKLGIGNADKEIAKNYLKLLTRDY